jgi:hypothetical protein
LSLAEQFVRGGFLSAEGIAEVEVDDLTGAVPELDPEVARQIHEKARQSVHAPTPTAS